MLGGLGGAALPDRSQKPLSHGSRKKKIKLKSSNICNSLHNAVILHITLVVFSWKEEKNQVKKVATYVILCTTQSFYTSFWLSFHVTQSFLLPKYFGRDLYKLGKVLSIVLNSMEVLYTSTNKYYRYRHHGLNAMFSH